MNSSIICRFVFALSMVVIIFLLISIPGTNAGNEDGGFKKVHFNMKAEDGLSPQYLSIDDTEAENKTVAAKYDQYPGTRANREWVDVGNWTSDEFQHNFTLNSGPFVFNVWFLIEDGDYSADPDWEFYLYHNDNEIATATVIGSENSKEHPIELIETANIDSQVSIKVGDTLRISIRYKAWEDCYLYFGNLTFDSGGAGELNTVKIVASSGMVVSVVFYDLLGIDWKVNGNAFCSAEVSEIKYYGNDTTTIEPAGFTFQEGELINLTRISFNGISLGDKEEVIISISYGPEDTSGGWILTYTNLTPTIQIITPPDDSTFNTTQVKFQFTLVDNEPLEYEILVDSNPNPSKSIAGIHQYDNLRTSNNITLTLEEGKTYYWKLIVTDGYNDNESEIRSFSLLDNTPPVIMHSGYNYSVFIAEEIHISVKVIDYETSVQSASLFYRKNAWDVIKYKKIALIKDGDYFNATIPKEDVGEDGIEYYIEATDGRNTITNPVDSETTFVIRVEGCFHDDVFLPGFEAMAFVAVITFIAIVENWKKRKKI